MNTSAALSHTIAELRECADHRTFNRGMEYFRAEAVGALYSFEDGVRATVHGSEPYDTWLEPQESGRLNYSCSCPVGVDCELCKHVVALGLRWRQAVEGGEALLPDKVVAADDLSEVLATASRQELIRWMQWALQDAPGLGLRIALAAGLAPPDRAIRIRQDLLTALRGLFDADLYDAEELLAVELTQGQRLIRDLASENPSTALDCLQELLVEVAALTTDVPSRGGSAQQALQGLYRLHRELAERHTPDPAALANWLFARGCAYDNLLGDVPRTYARALGTSGMARFASRVHDAWQALPPLGLGAKSQDLEDARHFLQAQMEAQVRDADPMDQVRVLQKDLGTGQRYRRILECLSRSASTDAQRIAVDWADEATRNFPADEDLASLAANAYLRVGAPDKAGRLMDRLFQTRPCAQRYRLGAHVLAPVPSVQAEFCANAFALLQQCCADQEAASRQRKPSAKTGTSPETSAPVPHTGTWCDFHEELGRVLVQRADAQGLWAHHRKKPLSEKLWCDIAELRASTHLEDALTLWRELIPRAMARSGTDYAEPASIVRAMHAACRSSRALHLFERERSLLRSEYGRRRNFMKHLDTLR